MYTIREDVKVKDLSLVTQKFLTTAGFSLDDNLSDMFKEFVEENNIDLNEKSVLLPLDEGAALNQDFLNYREACNDVFKEFTPAPKTIEHKTHEYKTTYFLVVDGSVIMHSKNHQECVEAICDIPFEIEYYPDMISTLSKEEIVKQAYMDSHEGVTFFVTDTYHHKDEFIDINILDVNYIWANWDEPAGQAVAHYLSVHMDIVDITIK